MKKWVLKAIVQKGISYLPYKHKINFLFQKYITKGVNLTEPYFEDRLTHYKHHSQFQEKYKGTLQGLTVMELGTGWHPVVPLGFFLSGADRIYTVDISHLTDHQKVMDTIAFYLKYHREGKLAPYCQALPERLQVLKDLVAQQDSYDWNSLSEALKLSYLVVDARKLPLEDNMVDLITSNNTFEHVFADVLRDILLSFKRVLKSDGLMSHFIDMSDHFAHLDQSITIYNFLQFSEQQWRLIDNSIQPQNRWRIPQFRELYQELNIPITEELNRNGDLEALRKVPVHASFNGMALEDLAVSHSYIVSDYS